MIFNIRGVQVMIDSDIAALYGIETRALNQAVKRNIDRFPTDFMFQLTKSEFENLKSQFVTSSSSHLISHFLYLPLPRTKLPDKRHILKICLWMKNWICTNPKIIQ